MAGGRFGISPRQQRVVSQLLQVAIGGILIIGLFTRNLSVVLNGALALAVTFLPAVLERDYRIPLDTGITLWITLALFLHTLGMLGFYSEVWWYDHVTHTLSATIVAGVGYATARAIENQSDAIYFPPRFMFVYILLFTLALGVFWEVLEFGARLSADILGLDPVLIQYGLDDSLLDLVFNTFGAFLVAAFGTGVVSDVVKTLTARLADYRHSNDTANRSDETVEGTRLGVVVRDDPVNARVSLLLIGLLIVVVFSGVAAGELLPAVLVSVVVVLAILPPLAYRDLRAMLPWQLLVLASLPVFGAVFARPWLSSGLVTYFAVATIALVVAVELHLFTSVEMTPEFAILFVIITTMAVADGWAVARWLADLYIGTELLLVTGQSESHIETRLMWDFVYSVIAGIFAGIVFEWGFRRRGRTSK